MLMLPSPGSGKWLDNWAATPSGTAPGTTITANGSANTKGNYAQLIAASAFPYPTYGITLIPTNSSPAGVVRRYLVDLAFGAAASEQVIAANLPIAGSGSIANTAPVPVFLPLYIPAGQRVAARLQSSTGSSTMSLMAILHTAEFPPHPVFQGCEVLGADTSDTSGEAHTPGNTGTFSTWANLGSPSSRQFKAIMPTMIQGTDTTMSSLLGYMEVGVSSTAFARWLIKPDNTEGVMPPVPAMPLYHNFPASTQFMMRATMSGTADSDYDFGLIGFY